jgi:hypothetical protein
MIAVRVIRTLHSARDGEEMLAGETQHLDLDAIIGFINVGASAVACAEARKGLGFVLAFTRARALAPTLLVSAGSPAHLTA